MKTFLEILQDGSAKYPFRDIIDNLTDDQICDVVEEYAEQFKPKWVPVEDEHPDLGDIVLVHSNGETWIKIYDSINDVDFTHWRTIPEPPTK